MVIALMALAIHNDSAHISFADLFYQTNSIIDVVRGNDVAFVIIGHFLAMSICALPRNVDVALNETGNRGLEACSSFKPGDVVLTNLPFAQIILGTLIRERCVSCFCKSESMFQCSKCTYARYCSGECQRRDWLFHKKECKLLTSLQNKMPHYVVQDVCLLVRTFQNPNQHSLDMPCYIVDDITSCGVGHVLDMSLPDSMPTQFSHEDTLVAAAVQKICKTVPLSSIQQMQFRFKYNNFGVLDELMQVIGAGVFPAAALLNHSCRPNCTLRYVLTPKQPMKLQVVACRPIQEGEELTHSYVDLVESTSCRRAKLMEGYGFMCRCSRCLPSASAHIHKFPVRFLEDGSYRHMLSKTSSAAAEGDRHTGSLDIEQALEALKYAYTSTEERHSVFAAAELLLSRAARAASPEEEQMLSGQAVDKLKAACGPFHMELYKARGQHMTACLVAGKFEAAAEECLHVVGFLHALLRDVPCHPLLGLQLFTLGDILQAVGPACGYGPAEVCEVYRRSLEILRCSYGPDHTLVLRLQDIIGAVSSC